MKGKKSNKKCAECGKVLEDSNGKIQASYTNCSDEKYRCEACYNIYSITTKAIKDTIAKGENELTPFENLGNKVIGKKVTGMTTAGPGALELMFDSGDRLRIETDSVENGERSQMDLMWIQKDATVENTRREMVKAYAMRAEMNLRLEELKRIETILIEDDIRKGKTKLFEKQPTKEVEKEPAKEPTKRTRASRN